VTTGGVATGGLAGTGCNASFESIQVGGKGLCVATLIELQDESSFTTPYSIDATEVTRGQYEAWLDAGPTAPLTAQASCVGNEDFWPNAACMAESYVCVTNCDHHPIVCVDWCDAYAYCEAVGKRLCGGIAGGANPYSSDGNVSTSQWYRACTSADPDNTYPYGKEYNPAACNGNGYPHQAGATTVDVGSATGCHSNVSGYRDVFDQSGNVWEWEDSCDSTRADAQCRLRGGSFLDGQGALTCGIDSGSGRHTVSYDYGFRCCSR
jgi:formylglycine-generating enzyme required for sulfatase activity